MKTLAIFRTKKSVAVVDPRAELYEEMRHALHSFTTAMKKYDAYAGSSIPYSQMLFAEVDVHRERYYNARITYERLYGNENTYRLRLAEFQEYEKGDHIRCLFRSSIAPDIILSDTPTA